MNTQIQDLKKMFRVVTIILITLTLVTPLIFASDMFFPFITGKAFFMRIMILLSSISYIGLITIDKSSRPKKTPLLYALLVFMIILLSSTMNGENPIRSFWSNFERMEGYLTMLYMSVLFIVSTSTIKKNEWWYIMNFSILISIIVGIKALGDTEQRISGTLGNSSYLGVYALIHVFLSILGGLMIYRGNREKELLLENHAQHAKKLNGMDITHIIIFVLTAIFNTYILYNTGTRGAFVGIVLGFIFMTLYFSIFEKNKVIKTLSIAFLIVLFSTIGFLGIFKNANFIKSSALLDRYASLITWDIRSVLGNQGHARVMIWKMAFEGVKEKPVLGWGQDNFGYVFTKYYDPKMYGQEQWFDRSHNVFMDWLIAGGVLGLLGYLSLFVIAIYFIFSKRSKFTVVEKGLWTALLIAYFVHNIFVFDNLSSYVLFFFILAYINDKYTHESHIHEDKKITENDINILIAVLFVSVLIAIWISYQTIFKPFTQNKLLINTLRSVQTTGISKKLNIDINKTFDMSPNGRFETFEQFSTLLGQIMQSTNISDDIKKELLASYEKITNVYDKTIANDSRYNYFVTNTYRSAGLLIEAQKYIDKAYDLSPNKQTFAYLKAITLFDQNKNDEALLILEKAYLSAPENKDAYSYYLGLLIQDMKNKSYNIDAINKVIDVSVSGYKDYKHDLILSREYWGLIENKNIKNLFKTRIIKSLPELKEKILEISN